MKSYMEENFMKMKNEKVILDSNVLIAFFNPSDSLHRNALALLKDLESQTRILNDLIFAEVGTVLLMKTKDLSFVSSILGKLFDDKAQNTQIILCTKVFLSQTLEIFSHQQSPQLSFEDCSIIALARTHKIRRIVTFDKAIRKTFAKEFEFLPKNI